MPLEELQIQNIEREKELLEVTAFSLELVKPELFDAILQRARAIHSERSSIHFIQLVLILYTTILIGCSPVLPKPEPDISEIPPTVFNEIRESRQELIKFSTLESATNLEQVEKFRDEVEQMVPPEEYIDSIFEQIFEMNTEEEKIITISVPIEGAYFRQMEIRIHFERYVSGIDALTGFDSMSKEDFAARKIKLQVGLNADEDWKNMNNEEKLLAIKHELTHVLQLTAM